MNAKRILQGEEIAVFRNRIHYARSRPKYDNAILREHIDQRWDDRGRETRHSERGRLELARGRVRVFFDNGEQQTFPLPLTGSERQWYRHDPAGSATTPPVSRGATRIGARLQGDEARTALILTLP